MSQTKYQQILLRRGAVTTIPSLAEGEPAFSTDSKESFVGTASGNRRVVAPVYSVMYTPLDYSDKSAALNLWTKVSGSGTMSYTGADSVMGAGCWAFTGTGTWAVTFSIGVNSTLGLDGFAYLKQSGGTASFSLGYRAYNSADSLISAKPFLASAVASQSSWTEYKANNVGEGAGSSNLPVGTKFVRAYIEITANTGTLLLDHFMMTPLYSGSGGGGGGGNTVLSGAGAPSSELGADGDFYIDTTADAIYGPKTSGSWGSSTSLIGPAGSNGVQGATGVQGIQGATGVQGIQGGTGVQGTQGSTGVGVQGETGLAGASGATGVAGASGATGVAGPKGGYLDTVVGSAAQVSANEANYSSIASAIAAVSAGAKIVVLAGTYTENITVNKKIMLVGVGHDSYINGTLTVTSAATGSSIKDLKVGGNITIQASANNIFLRDCWQTTGLSITDSGTNNSILVIQE